MLNQCYQQLFYNYHVNETNTRGLSAVGLYRVPGSERKGKALKVCLKFKNKNSKFNLKNYLGTLFYEVNQHHFWVLLTFMYTM